MKLDRTKMLITTSAVSADILQNVNLMGKVQFVGHLQLNLKKLTKNYDKTTIFLTFSRILES